MSIPWSVWQATERVMAVAILAAASPVLLVSAVMIGARARRSPLLLHRRIGQFGAPFWMLKYRTMWGPSAPEPAAHGFGGIVDFNTDAPLNGKPRSDPRVGDALARFLRRYSLDELPQLVHVVTGRMSLVGPRPLTAVELERYYNGASEEVLRLKPGLTGLWQVLGRSRLTYSQRRRLDLFLARKRSVRLYAWILMRTIPRVLSGKDAW